MCDEKFILKIKMCDSKNQYFYESESIDGIITIYIRFDEKKGTLTHYPFNKDRWSGTYIRRSINITTDFLNEDIEYVNETIRDYLTKKHTPLLTDTNMYRLNLFIWERIFPSPKYKKIIKFIESRSKELSLAVETNERIQNFFKPGLFSYLWTKKFIDLLKSIRPN